MRRRIRVLLDHPVVRTLLFERLLITGAATLAVVAGAALLLAAAVPILVPRRAFAPPATVPFDVDPLLAGAFFLLLGLEVAALVGAISWIE